MLMEAMEVGNRHNQMNNIRGNEHSVSMPRCYSI